MQTATIGYAKSELFHLKKWIQQRLVSNVCEVVWPRSICLSDFASQKSSKKRSRCASPKLSDFASLHDGPAPTRSKSRRSSKDPVESVGHSKSRRSKDPVESIEELSGPRLHAPKRDGKVDQAAVGTGT